jgi:hypothetical protein
VKEWGYPKRAPQCWTRWLQSTAVEAALSRIKQKELHKELTTGAEHVEEIQVVTDRSALAREAMAALRELPQAEEEDDKIIVQSALKQFAPGAG